MYASNLALLWIYVYVFSVLWYQKKKKKGVLFIFIFMRNYRLFLKCFMPDVETFYYINGKPHLHNLIKPIKKLVKLITIWNSKSQLRLYNLYKARQKSEWFNIKVIWCDLLRRAKVVRLITKFSHKWTKTWMVRPMQQIPTSARPTTNTRFSITKTHKHIMLKAVVIIIIVLCRVYIFKLR